MPDERAQTKSEEADALSPLNYRDVRDDVPRNRGNEIAGAALATTIIWVGAIAGLLLFAFQMDYRGGPKPNGVAGIRIAGLTAVVMLASTVTLGIRWQRRPDKKHLAIGIWIGMGVTLLIEGLCFTR